MSGKIIKIKKIFSRVKRIGRHWIVWFAAFALLINFGLFGHLVFAKDVTATYELNRYWFFDDDGTTVNNASGWSSPNTNQDTSITNVSKNSNLRLRLGIQQYANKPTVNLGFTPKIQYKAGASACTDASGWTDVPTESACGSSPICRATSAVFSDNAATTQRFTAETWLAGGDGVSVDGAPNQVSVTSGTADLEQPEWEWMLRVTGNATLGATYTVRAVYTAGTALDNYVRCPTLQIISTAAPSISSLSFNSGNNITLNEGTFKWASSTMTITDDNGCDTVSSVAATAYRTAAATVGSTCSQNDNNCYTSTCAATTTGNTCGASPDTTGQFDCGFKFWYIADPTDAGAYAGNIWAVAATATDGGGSTGTATNAGQLVEVNSLNALDVTTTINYGTLSAGADTGANNKIMTATTTGNTAIDAEVNGSRYMCTDWPTCAANTIDVWNQKYDTSDVTYNSLTNFLTSTTTPRLELSNIKPTSTTTYETDIVYWGIGVPSGTPDGDYTGTTTFTAIAD